jgi:hypothetical protein
MVRKDERKNENNVGFQIVETSETLHDKLQKPRNVNYLIATNC